MKVLRVSKLVDLPVNESNKYPEYIPTSNEFQDNASLVEQVAISVIKRMPVLLVGETGTGKTSLVRFLANRTKNGFRRVNHNGGTTVEDIIGRTLINKEGTFWVDGVLTEAMRKGLWYLADEINASTPEINFIYHSLLDDDGYIVLPENNGEIVKPHPDFRFFGAMNPATEYSGAKELNKALLSRFIVVKADFPDVKTEVKILTKRTGIKAIEAERLAKYASELRSSFSKGKIQFVISTRELLAWSEMLKVYGKYIPSAEITVLNKVDKEDEQIVKDLLSLHFKGLDEPKATTASVDADKVADFKASLTSTPVKKTRKPRATKGVKPAPAITGTTATPF